MNYKSIFAGLSCLVLLSIATGCANSAVSYGDSYRELKASSVLPTKLSGRYNITNVEFTTSSPVSSYEEYYANKIIGERLTRDLRSALPHAFDNNGGTNIPVRVLVKFDENHNIGFLGTINDILSICTLTVWPMYMNTDYTYEVSVVFPDRVEQQTYELSEKVLASILPLGLIPVPAWADERTYSEVEAVKNLIQPKLMRKAVEKSFADK